MMNRREKKNALTEINRILMESYADGVGVNNECSDSLPRRAEVIGVTEKLLELIFPGFDRAGTYPSTLVLLGDVLRELADQIERAMHRVKGGVCDNCEDDCSGKCDEFALTLLRAVPEIRETLKLDVEAAYNGDPAAESYEEIICCYPVIKAMVNYRVAHQMLLLGVRLIPRIMTELAHSETGIDIHPAATIGHHFTIDHGTGVVIGATCIIGNNVKLYQGVTLGAKSFPLDENGNPIKGIPRHPILEDDVIIYSNATVLGRITIGRGTIIGGNLWVTEGTKPGKRLMQKRNSI
jgi:serine O-acetyltransferase